MTSGSKPRLKDKIATPTVNGEIRIRENAIVLVIATNMLNTSRGVIPQRNMPKMEEVVPNMMLLSKAIIITVYRSNLNSFVFPLKLALMVPKWRLVLRRPQKRPPIEPLILSIPGKSARDQGVREKILK